MKKTLFFLLIVVIVISFLPFPHTSVKLTDAQENYIWEWEWENVTLLIKENSYLNYRESSEGNKSLISWYITNFGDNNFEVWPFYSKKNLKIDKEPYKEWNLWKIYVNWKELSREIEGEELYIPENYELNNLTNNFFILYNNSVYKNNYKFFYDNLSKKWQDKTSEKELKTLIAPTIVYKVDINDIIKKDIVYSKPPYINKDKLLVLEWYYQSTPLLSFVLKFTYEHPDWKIAWFDFFY